MMLTIPAPRFSPTDVFFTLCQHVVGHHVYTNVFGADPDLPMHLEGDPRRLVDRQKNSSVYKYQHIYLPPLYGILGLKVNTSPRCIGTVACQAQKLVDYLPAWIPFLPMFYIRDA